MANRSESAEIYYLASCYFGLRAAERRRGGDLCASPVTRGGGARDRERAHTLTSPLSLRGDSHSEKLTGRPEAGESETEEGKREQGESHKNKTLLSGEIQTVRGKR